MERITDYAECQHLQVFASECERIANILTGFADAEQARRISGQLFEWALEMEAIAQEIWSDPIIRRTYAYDGVLFTFRDGRPGFHKFPDGLHFLQMLTEENLRCFASSLLVKKDLTFPERLHRYLYRLQFWRAAKRNPISDFTRIKTYQQQSLLRWLQECYVEIAQARQRNFQQGGFIGLMHPEEIRERIRELDRQEAEHVRGSQAVEYKPEDPFWRRLEAQLRDVQPSTSGRKE